LQAGTLKGDRQQRRDPLGPERGRGAEPIGKDRRVLDQEVAINVVPHRQNDLGASIDFAGGQSGKLSLWPRLCEESGAENHDAKATLCQRGFDTAA
jgi:hypothetical protein